MDDRLPSLRTSLPTILQASEWRMKGLYWSQDGIASEQEGELRIYHRPTEWYLLLRSWNPESALTWEVWSEPWSPDITRRPTRAMSTIFGPNQGLIWLRGDGSVYWRYRIPRMNLVGTDVYTAVSDTQWQMRGQLLLGPTTVATYEWTYERVG